jgi:hypothetical protein
MWMMENSYLLLTYQLQYLWTIWHLMLDIPITKRYAQNSSQNIKWLCVITSHVLQYYQIFKSITMYNLSITSCLTDFCD